MVFREINDILEKYKVGVTDIKKWPVRFSHICLPWKHCSIVSKSKWNFKRDKLILKN